MQDRVFGAGCFERLVFQGVDGFVEVIEHGQIGVHHVIDDAIVNLVGARIAVGGFRDLLDEGLHLGTIVFHDGDEEVLAQEDVEVGGQEGAVGIQAHAFHNGEDVPGALFDLGVLVAVAAVLDVQRVQVVALGQAVEFGAVGVEDLMPFHLLTA